MGIFDPHNFSTITPLNFGPVSYWCLYFWAIAKYKKALKEDAVGIGRSPEEVIRILKTIYASIVCELPTNFHPLEQRATLRNDARPFWPVRP
jgi:hypothetical protein